MRNRTVIIVVIAVGALLLCCCAAGAVVLVSRGAMLSRSTVDVGELIQGGNVEATNSLSQQFTVGSRPLVVVDSEVGTVHVSAGTTGVVSVQAEVHARARSDSEAMALLTETAFDASGDEERVNITVDVPDSSGGRGNVDVELTITVPAGTSVQVRNLVGDVSVKGVSGTAAVSTNVGNVEWVGALPESGAVTLTTGVGNVRCEMPEDSAFHLDAGTGTGELHSDFAVPSGEAPDSGLLGDTVRGDYGANPQVTVELHTDVGEISIVSR
ncbi:MAG: DUF4097 family beta strand repeat-containing protein [Anaerolineae bacterium]